MKILAMILAGGRVDSLSVLTLNRPKSAMPFGGVYRIIDFALSNLMHSGITLVGVLSQYRSYSLIHHVGTGTAWDFVGRKRGAFILPPSKGSKSSDWYRGTADAMYQNLDFIDNFNPEMVLVLSGDHIYKMNFNKLVQFHQENNADITISFVQRPDAEASRFGLARFDDSAKADGGRLVGYDEKPEHPSSNWASMTIYLFKTTVLRQVLALCENKDVDHFGRDIFPHLIDQYNIYGYMFRDTWGYTQTIDEYWLANMELLRENSKINLKQWELRTNLANKNIRDRMPTKFSPTAKINNSLIYNGCKVHGKVNNSIIFPGVVIEDGALVQNSIVFYDTIIRKGARLNKVILDEQVEIGTETEIGAGTGDQPNQKYPLLLTTGITIIGQNTRIPASIKICKNCIVAPDLVESNFSKIFYDTGEFIQ